MASNKIPDHLTDEARKEWRRIMPELESVGMLPKIDRAALAAYCQAWATMVEADREIESLKAAQVQAGSPVQSGLVIVTKSGNVIPNPFLGIRNTALKLLTRLASELGFTPRSRGKVTPGQDETPPPGLGD